MDTLAAEPTQKRSLTINVEMDDRGFLFPDGKMLSHISVSSNGTDELHLDGLYHFNQTRLDPRFCTLDLADAKDFARKIIDAFYQGRTQHVISDRARVAIIFNPNGFLVQFGDLKEPTELFISASAILRLAHALLRVADSVSPVVAN